VILFCDATKEANEKRYPKKLGVETLHGFCWCNNVPAQSWRFDGPGGESNQASGKRRIVIRVTEVLPFLPILLPPPPPVLVSICPKTGMKRR
jgi:hypothetical protein